MSAAPEPESCPRCGSVSDDFVPVEAGMRLALKDGGTESQLPNKVCPACYEKLTNSVSQGMKLRMERDMREKNKMMMWKNRVHLIKNARNLMSQKAYSEAAVQYEKYLRLLEVVYNLKKGELSPAVFNNSSRSKELTVVTSVYWDLVRIYDTSPRYGDRMQRAASKLAQFLPVSAIYPDIIRKADSFSRSCKNPQIMREFLKAVKARKGACFVATAAFSSEPFAVELYWLRRFRDGVLRPSRLGRGLIWLYYRWSPSLAQWVGRSPRKRQIARWLITKAAHQLKRWL